MDYIKTTFSLLVTTLYSMSSMEWKVDFCFLDNYIKKINFNVILLFINHYSKKHDVVIRFSLPQRENNQMVQFIFSLKLIFLLESRSYLIVILLLKKKKSSAHPILFNDQAKQNKPKKKL